MSTDEALSPLNHAARNGRGSEGVGCQSVRVATPGHNRGVHAVEYDPCVVLIRREEPDDVPIVREVNRRAFGRPDEGRLVDVVRQRREPTISLVAVDPDVERIVGHILFSPVTIESEEQSRTAIGLGPVAVEPGSQRSGVGTQLIERGLELCREAEYGIAVVLGHPNYYSRFGFVIAHAHGIHWEHEMPGDPFMVIELSPGALEGVKGRVRYLPEFMSL